MEKHLVAARLIKPTSEARFSDLKVGISPPPPSCSEGSGDPVTRVTPQAHVIRPLFSHAQLARLSIWEGVLTLWGFLMKRIH